MMPGTSQAPAICLEELANLGFYMVDLKILSENVVLKNVSVFFANSCRDGTRHLAGTSPQPSCQGGALKTPKKAGWQGPPKSRNKGGRHREPEDQGGSGRISEDQRGGPGEG